MQNIDNRIAALLEWINNTQDDTLKPSSHSYISPKLIVKHTEGSGRGLYAADSIGSNERLVRIPPLFLLNFTTVLAHITKHNDKITLTEPPYNNIYVPQPVYDSVGRFYAELSLQMLLELLSFQLISFFLVLERSRGANSYWKPFIDMLPDISELGLAPIVWKIHNVANCDLLWRMLPRSARKHADSVVARFEKDYLVVTQKIPNSSTLICREDFLWAWMCINSRCLYMEMPQSKDANDNFTMAPYVDFLNHLNDDQCGIKIDTLGFHVVTSCNYLPGEELYFSYGPHSNEFLFCEYGFSLRENKWNYIDISDFIVPLLRPAHVDFLKKTGYYGEYTVNSSGMSFRTEIALAVLQEGSPEDSRKLKAFIDGFSDGLIYTTKLRELLNRILQKLINDCERKLSSHEEYEEKTSKRVAAVLSLYKDIQHIAHFSMSE